MSESTPDRRAAGTRGQAADGQGQTGPSGADGTGDGTRRAAGPTTGEGRRVPVWLMVAVGVLLVVVAGVIAMVVNDRGATDEVLEPEVVTLPVPTPTIEPVERPEGTAFQQALPSTVLDLALTEIAEDTELVTEGALESYRAVYGDGGDREVVVTAGQWPTAEEAAAVLDAQVAAAESAAAESGAAGAEDGDAAAEGDADAEVGATVEGEDADGSGNESAATGATGAADEGTVEVDGEQVGRWVLVPGDGTETVWWTNGTALLRATGPAGSVRDVHTAFGL